MKRNTNMVVLAEPEPMVILSLQEVVDRSHFFLKLHSAMLYGLMEGPKINPERCEHYLAMGKRHGIEPNDDYMPTELFVNPNTDKK